MLSCEYDLNASARNAPKSPHVFAQNFDYFVSGSEIDLRISCCFVSSECTPYPDHSAANPNPRKDITKTSERILNDCLTAVHKTKQQWNETTHMERHEAAFLIFSSNMLNCILTTPGILAPLVPSATSGLRTPDVVKMVDLGWIHFGFLLLLF